MVLNEKEAAEKWCPQARVGTSHEPGYCLNRNVAEPAKEAMCIGSRCMMWCWVDNGMGWEMYERGETKSPEYHPSKRRGTCGLIKNP